jgi:activator of 2-hydroxyglutaryl-CoA dehydratase
VPEVVSLVAHGAPVPVILGGLHRSLTRRINSMIHRVGLDPPFMLSGGVVLNSASVRCWRKRQASRLCSPVIRNSWE